MDKVVQAAAANAEESSSAAEELASQAQELAAMVGRFHLAGKDGQPVAAAATAGRSAAKAAAPASRREKRTERPVASKTTAGWQLKPEDIIPLDDELALSEF